MRRPHRAQTDRPANRQASKPHPLMPLFSRPWIIVAALFYLAVTLAIGLWAMRRTRNARDFFVAGQSIGLIVAGLAAMSASFSGFVFLGGPGLTYRIGLAALFINVPLSLTAGMMCWTLAKRLRLLAEVREVFTIPDAIACRYGNRQTAGLAAGAVIVGTLGYLGSQFLALGRLLEFVFDSRESLGPWSLPLGMAVGLAVVLSYSIAGGMIAGVYTDLFQGTLMMVTAGALFLQAIRVTGGLERMTEAISRSSLFGPGFLQPFGLAPIMTAVGFFFVFSVGTLGQPHVLHKFYMLKDPQRLKWMPVVLAGSQSVCVLVWLGLGIAVPALVASGQLEPLQHADDAAPTFLLHFTPELLAGIAMAGILAAIMSTADSFLSIGAAALVRDLPRALGRKVKDELWWGRLAVLGIALAAAFLAYLYNDLIALLGTFAFGTFAAALAPALAIGMNWRGVTARAASISIITGMALNLTLEFLGRQTYFPGLPKIPYAPGALPSAVALAASFTVLFVVSWLDRAPADLDPDIEAVLDT